MPIRRTRDRLRPADLPRPGTPSPSVARILSRARFGGPTAPLVEPGSYLVTESGDRLVTEAGDPIVTD